MASTSDSSDSDQDSADLNALKDCVVDSIFPKAPRKIEQNSNSRDRFSNKNSDSQLEAGANGEDLRIQRHCAEFIDSYYERVLKFKDISTERLKDFNESPSVSGIKDGVRLFKSSEQILNPECQGLSSPCTKNPQKRKATCSSSESDSAEDERIREAAVSGEYLEKTLNSNSNRMDSNDTTLSQSIKSEEREKKAKKKKKKQRKRESTSPERIPDL